MKLTFLFVLVSATVVDVPAQSTTQPDAKAVAYLKKFRSDYCKSMLEAKPAMMQAYYSDTVRLMPPFQKTVLGKTNAGLYHKAFASRVSVHEFTRNEIEVLDLGSQVMETGTLSIRLTVKSTGKEYTLAAKYLDLWVETKTGDLQLITQAWSYDQYYNGFHESLKFDEVPSIHAALNPNVRITDNISFELAALNRLLDVVVTEHDARTWMQFYSTDAILMASNHPICQGKEAIDAYIDMHVKGFPTFESLDIRNDRIDNLGTYVIEYASHIASWRNGDWSGVGLGKNIRVWRREPDHSLKLFRSIGMYD